MFRNLISRIGYEGAKVGDLGHRRAGSLIESGCLKWSIITRIWIHAVWTPGSNKDHYRAGFYLWVCRESRVMFDSSSCQRSVKVSCYARRSIHLTYSHLYVQQSVVIFRKLSRSLNAPTRKTKHVSYVSSVFPRVASCVTRQQ
jgi:hypothetical protein